jgi:catechol 2,3-dioxygenase-like lactoylglutathione lyase family enzyme
MADISLVTLVVTDYDEAISFYVNAVGFWLVEDTPLGDGKRWVVLRPPGSAGTGILLGRAATPGQREHVGSQTGGRVFLFLSTDDFDRDYARMRAAGVRFTEPARRERYGMVAVWEDLYGNRWDLIQPS